MNANLQESLSGVRVAQAYAREDRNIGGFRALNSQYLAARTAAQRLIALYFPFVLLLADLGAAVVLGARRGAGAATARSRPGVLIAFLLYLNLFFAPIQQLSQVFDTWQQAGASMEKIDELMAHADRHAPGRRTRRPAGELQGAIRFEDVRFRYPGTVGAEALAGVDLDDPRRARPWRSSARPAPASRRS